MTISKLDTILAAIVVELLAVGNATGIGFATYKDVLKAQKGMSGSITALVKVVDSEVDIEGSQYFHEKQRFQIVLYGRSLPNMKLAADVIKVLFYKETPLANIRTAGGNWIGFKGIEYPDPLESSAMELTVNYELDYETSYTL